MQLLLETAPADMFTLLWTLANKRSHWEPLVLGSELIADKAVGLAEASDVYIGVSLVATPAGPDRRTSNENSLGLFGLWADIDIADPDIHKRWNLPPDEDAARLVLIESGLEPTMLVHSGHGLQAWWLFNEFWAFDTDKERQDAYALAQRWNVTLRVLAAKHSWTIDSTFDLARVMRIPGTVNRKGDPAMPVRLIETGGLRYSRDSFEEHCVDDSVLRELGISAVEEYKVDANLVLREDAWPPGPWMEALHENVPEAKLTWDRKRKEPSWTASEWDMSLASFAVQAGATDQMIADYLIAGRRKNNADMSKVLRMDYMVRTIRRARSQAIQSQAIEKTDEALEALAEAETNQDDEGIRDWRRKVYDGLGPNLGDITIVHIWRYMSEPRSYAIETHAGYITFNRIEDINNQDHCRNRIEDFDKNVRVFRHKQPAWDRITTQFRQSTIDVDLGPEATERGQTQVWLQDYLAARVVSESLMEAQEMEYPWYDHEGIHIFATSFKRWLFAATGEKLTNQKLGRLLRQLGCIKSTPNVMTDKGRTQKTTWLLPPGAVR